MDTYVYSAFWLVWIMPLWPWVCKHLFETLPSILLDVSPPDTEFLGRMAFLFLVFLRKLSLVFHSGYTSLQGWAEHWKRQAWGSGRCSWPPELHFGTFLCPARVGMSWALYFCILLYCTYTYMQMKFTLWGNPHIPVSGHTYHLTPLTFYFVLMVRTLKICTFCQHQGCHTVLGTPHTVRYIPRTVLSHNCTFVHSLPSNRCIFSATSSMLRDKEKRKKMGLVFSIECKC